MRPKIHKTLIGLFVLLLAALWLQSVHAQEPPIAVNVDRTELTTNDTLTLSVVVTSSEVIDPPLPVLPQLDRMVLVDQGSTSRIFIENNRASLEAVHTYVFRPTEAGSLTIGPISFTTEGETYSTSPIFVDVTAADPTIVTAPTSELPEATLSKLVGQDFFVEAEVDNTTPYIGEQVMYTLRFFRSVNIIDQPRYDAPRFTGFWNSEEPSQTRFEVQAADLRYRVLELSTILFPTVSGSLTIEPATLTVSRSASEPEIPLRTATLGMTVFPTPENPPDDFTGAVGKFDISADIESTSGIINDPVILTVTIRGQGNLDTLPDPVWPEIERWRSFDSTANVETLVTEDTVTGSKIYERILIPTLSGEYTIPPVSYSYFDPDLGEYRTVATRPIAVTIIPGASGLMPLEVQQLKPVPAALDSASQPLTENGIYWVAWSLPLVLLGSLATWRFFRNRQKYDTPEARRRNAHRKARKLLAREGRNGNDPYILSSQVLTMYISDKLNHSIYGMTYENLDELLTTQGVGPDLVERVNACLTASDESRFSPKDASNDSDREMIERTRSLISDLEKGIGA